MLGKPTIVNAATSVQIQRKHQIDTKATQRCCSTKMMNHPQSRILFYFIVSFTFLIKKNWDFISPKKLPKIVEITLGKFYFIFLKKPKISQPFRFEKRPVFFFFFWAKVTLSTSSVSL
jgi:hypothetical protein